MKYLRQFNETMKIDEFFQDKIDWNEFNYLHDKLIEFQDQSNFIKLTVVYNDINIYRVQTNKNKGFYNVNLLNRPEKVSSEYDNFDPLNITYEVSILKGDIYGTTNYQALKEFTNNISHRFKVRDFNTFLSIKKK